MAPEVLRCQPYCLKSDIFSAGAIIFEMISDSDPLFTSSSSAKMIAKNMKCNISSKLAGLKCSPSLISLLKMMLSAEP